ncbi:MAG: DNA cytosine methyltransferase [Geobacteraceae bacterium]|nr:DNA cytosine methyltransferase [Geobacteraceae bacterium]
MSIVLEKLARIRAGHQIRYMDIFAGCGGISLGFLTAGFLPVAFVEIDERAAASHGANFATRSIGMHTERHYAARDIILEDPLSIFSDLGIRGAVEDQVDVLVGGPPCQAFARVGRAKLREQAHRREEETADCAFLVDGRVNLWQRYVEYVRATKPIALLMENVPDILNHGQINVAELVARSLSDEGYEVRYTLLNASWYGTPQTRERMILIGFHRETQLTPLFPAPTHHVVLPRGYEGTKSTARKIVIRHGSDHHRYIADPDAGLPSVTTAREALADLPPIYALDLFQKGQLRRGVKDPREVCTYTSPEPTTAWSRLMRHWDDFRTTDHTTGHVIRFLPRDYKIFAELGNGWQYPEIWQHVENKISAWLKDRSERGLSTDHRNADVRDFIESWRIPYDKNKFPNKWWVLEAEKPVRTLLAHLGKDSYSHIHYDPIQARTISVREAARLQGFPDGFQFCGSMNPAFKQIGNAVPPLFAYALAVAMRSTMGIPVTDDIRVRLLGLEQSLIQTTEGLA